MAESVLAAGVELRKGCGRGVLVECERYERRVVAEAAVAVRRAQQHAVAAAFDCESHRAVLAAEAKAADEVRAALLVWNRAQFVEEAQQAAAVIEPLAPVARAEHTRTATECVDAEPRVVSEGYSAGCNRQALRFLARVAGEVRLVLDRVPRPRQLLRCAQADTKWRQHALELGELLLVAGNEGNWEGLLLHLFFIFLSYLTYTS